MNVKWRTGCGGLDNSCESHCFLPSEIKFLIILFPKKWHDWWHYPLCGKVYVELCFQPLCRLGLYLQYCVWMCLIYEIARCRESDVALGRQIMWMMLSQVCAGDQSPVFSDFKYCIDVRPPQVIPAQTSQGCGLLGDKWWSHYKENVHPGE